MIALVTGGSRGLGRDMALSLAKKGYNVVITYNTKKDEADTVVKAIKNAGQKASALQLNVSDQSNYDSFINSLSLILKEEFGTDKVDYFINNAGYVHYVKYEEATEEQFNDMADVHLKAPFFLTQKMLGVMNDGGGIVNISTGLTRFSFPGFAVYAAMKGALETLTKYQAKELGERKIRANVVAPGAIETDFGGGKVRDDEEMNQFIASATALGRAGLPDDIGGVVAFLCSEDAKWINGQRIEVSGGMLL